METPPTILPTYTLMVFDQTEDGSYGAFHVFATNEPTTLISKSIDDYPNATGFVVHYFKSVIIVTLSNNQAQAVVSLPSANTIVSFIK